MALSKKLKQNTSRTYRLLTGSNLPTGLLTALSLLTILLIMSTFFYSVVEGWSLFDAFYFSAITVTTVGYGDLIPTHNLSKIYTIGLIFVGVGLALYAFTTLAKSIIEGRRKRF